MLFSSISFLVFFLPCVLLAYYALPNKAYRNCVLLIASLLFYAWGEPKFVLLMVASIIFNYNMGLLLKDRASKKTILCFSIIANLAVLFVFKYLGFSCRIISIVLNSLHIPPLSELNLVMPIGISFYTFQEISYLVDVYRKPGLAQENVLNLGLYVCFFPQLVAGPIVRYQELDTQITSRTGTSEQFAAGLERFIVGLGKKVLLANSFASVCDGIYNADFFSYGSGAAWVAAFAYALQIYYDFSGYSDMAIGLGKLFGFELPENFNYPYAASSITDFWKRWHITLTDFFRGYVYIPLGGNRRGNCRTAMNRFIVFFTTGLWHGAAFNFIIWGLAHGTLMTAERVFCKQTGSSKGSHGLRLAKAVLSRTYTLFSVLMLWIVFRNGTKRSLKTIMKMFGLNYTRFTRHFRPVVPNYLLLYTIDSKFWILFAIGILLSFPWWRKLPVRPDRGAALSILISVIRYASLTCIFLLCYASLAANSYNPFIYFRF